MGDQYPFGFDDPTCVDLTNADPRDVTCFIHYSPNDYDGNMGARVSSVFVILFVSTAVTFFPVLATRVKWLKIPLYVYLFARYFGTGVIIATGFIHLLDPSYSEIGSDTCVGSTGGWAKYSWPPALALTSVMATFLMDLVAGRYVEKKYGISQHESVDLIENAISTRHVDAAHSRFDMTRSRPSVAGVRSRKQCAPQHLLMSSPDQTTGADNIMNDVEHNNQLVEKKRSGIANANSSATDTDSFVSKEDQVASVAFKQQISAFLILEFGILFHSVIIGLTLGAAGSEFGTLYPVIVFHQSFEGLGLGARLSAIPFPRRLSWMPWALCAGYGLTTPIAIAIGLGVRTSFDPNGYSADVVEGILDGISAGILIYTGLVELLARDFMFNPHRTDNDWQLAFMVICMLLGAGLMALLGKWA